MDPNPEEVALAKQTWASWLALNHGKEKLASVRLYAFALSCALRSGMDELALVDVMFKEIRQYLREAEGP